MPLHVPSMTAGSPDGFPVFWESFVKLVLEITMEAYQRMRQDGVAQQDWEEDTFSVVLTENYIQNVVRRRQLSLVAMTRTRVHTAAMKTGEVSPKHATEIDIRLFHPWTNYDRVYFAWECKRIGDKLLDTSFAALISQYVTEGIFRFIDEDYAAELDDAGMLGYVLAGDIGNIVRDINASMGHPNRTRRLLPSNHLFPAPMTSTDENVYRSRHKRSTSQRDILLHHLFLTFDFKQ